MIKKFSPSTEVLVWDMAFCDGAVDMSWLHTDAILSDFDLKGKLKPLWSYASTHIVVSKPSRNPPLGWYYQKLFLEHSFCGGASNGHWWCHVYSASNASIILIRQAQRDMSAIITPTISGGSPCLPLKSEPGKYPILQEVKPGIFHSQGLLPWSNATPWVIVQSIFSPHQMVP